MHDFINGQTASANELAELGDWNNQLVEASGAMLQKNKS